MSSATSLRAALVLFLLCAAGCASPISRASLAESDRLALAAAFEGQRPDTGEPPAELPDLGALIERTRRGVVLIEVPQAATFGAYLEEIGGAGWSFLVEFPDLGELFNLPWTLAFGWLDTRGITLQGSGLVIATDDTQAYILTNAHVLGKRGRGVLVRLHGAGQDAFVRADLLWTDPRIDLALLRAPLEGSEAAALPLGTARPHLGKWSLVVGYPVRGDAYNPPYPSVSAGVLSSWNVQIEPFQRPPGVVDPPGLIQTEAAINPGNSGGPLLDLSGQVLGVVCSRLADSDGVGFAIPIQWALHAIARDLGLDLQPLGLRLKGDEAPLADTQSKTPDKAKSKTPDKNKTPDENTDKERQPR